VEIISQANDEVIKNKPLYTVILDEPPLIDLHNSNETSDEKKTDEDIEDPEDLDCAQAKESEKSKETDSENKTTKKSQLEEFKKKKLEFSLALSEIYIFGQKCKQEFAQQAFNVAIPGLAMILGTYRAYFDDANDVEREKLIKVITVRCRVDLGKNSLNKSDKRTSPWHLLSRLFRNSDRRQASADAKILKLAYAEGATLESFESWVKGYGTLSKILRKVPTEDEASDKELSPKGRKSKPLSTWVKTAEVPDDNAQEALSVLKKLADGKKYTTCILHEKGRYNIMRLIEQTSAPVTGTKNDEKVANDETDLEQDLAQKDSSADHNLPTQDEA